MDEVSQVLLIYKLGRISFSKVTCVLLNQTHEWGFCLVWQPHQGAGDTRSRLRCSLGQMFTPAQPNTFLGLHQRTIRLRPVGLHMASVISHN